MKPLAVFAFLVVCFLIVGTIDHKVKVEAEAERKAGLPKVEVKMPPKREPLFLTHPLSCEGVWIKKCADFKPCETICTKEQY